jgi:alcohol dehydrogenase, propanol-preferring
MMKAALLQEFKKPLVVTNVERPVPADDEVLIQIEACGVCHSDLHVAEGDWTALARIVKKPVVLGHEVAGKVVEKGRAVKDLQVGDRVGVPWIYWSCGECEFCRQGDENLCSRQMITGVTVDGGYAQFMKARATHAEKIPQGLSPLEVAPLFCAGVTVYRALRQSKISRGQRLAVFGVGGLGHLAIQIARNLGAEITAIDVADEKLAMAKSLGAASTLNAKTTEVVKELRAQGGAHVALVTSAAKAAYDMAFYGLRPTGTLMVVGLPAENISFPAIMMAAGEVHIKASAVGTRTDLREVLAMAASGKLHCQVAARPLDEINQVLDEMRSGRIAGRIVLSI